MSRGIRWHVWLDRLLRGYGVYTKGMLWIDVVQTRRLDSFMVQNLSYNYRKLTKDMTKEDVMKEVTEKNKLAKFFRGVNIVDSLLGAFGLHQWFLTEGRLTVRILQGKNIPSFDLFHVRMYYYVDFIG